MSSAVRVKKFHLGKFTQAMLFFVPVSMFCYFILHDKLLTFITSIVAIVPLAIIIGDMTKEISLQTNPTISGLISATFGNIIELIIAIIALQQGLVRVVQASVIGSIIGNVLLLIGLSIFFGGTRFKYQYFNKEAASVSATMLIIAMAGLALPTLFAYTNPDQIDAVLLSDFVAAILAIIYFAGLLFSLWTHKDLFDASDEMKAQHEKPVLSKQRASIYLFLATVIVAIESELLVDGLRTASAQMGIRETFIGVVILAVITNIAEKTAAIKFARENKLDVSLEIGLSSAIQISLFVVPILVFISHLMNAGFSLVFSPFEIIAILMAVLIVNALAIDGRCNWLEGAQLLTVYLIIATAFFFI